MISFKIMQFEYKRSFGSTSYMGTFEGIVNNLERRYTETQSDYAKAFANAPKYIAAREFSSPTLPQPLAKIPPWRIIYFGRA